MSEKKISGKTISNKSTYSVQDIDDMNLKELLTLKKNLQNFKKTDSKIYKNVCKVIEEKTEKISKELQSWWNSKAFHELEITKSFIKRMETN